MPKCYMSRFAEKFAELIVRECMDIAYEYDAPKNKWTWYDYCQQD